MEEEEEEEEEGRMRIRIGLKWLKLRAWPFRKRIFFFKLGCLSV